jgi:hypothetical protein
MRQCNENATRFLSRVIMCEDDCEVRNTCSLIIQSCVAVKDKDDIISVLN